VRCLRPAILCLLASVCSGTAGAQTFEAGASIATSCKGSDGSFCNETHNNLRTAGPYVSIWFGDFIEVSGRVAWLDQPDLESTLVRPTELTYTITERHRTIGQGEVVWHFRRGKRVRPLVGFGLGSYWDRELVACQPAGCEAHLGVAGLTAGEGRESHFDQSVVAGISALLHPRLRVRAGLRYHNPFKDELALSEWFVALGYRFGRS
jgi:hypothetical protein